MKNKTFYLSQLLIIIGICLLLGNSCKKHNDIPTKTEIPILTTDDASIVLQTTAICGGNITYEGSSTVSTRGICWSTSQNPTISNNKTIEGSGKGTFTSNLSNLTPVTTYYARAYATNSFGTNYGNQVVFKTTSTTPDGTIGSVTDIDGNVYSTVYIAGMEWMSENLKVTKYNNGTNIPYIADYSTWSNLTSTAFCWYNASPYYLDSINYVNTYGFLYNGYFVDDLVNLNKDICPIGWHVPTDAEWTTLTTYLGGSNIAGKKLKEAGVSHWLNNTLLTTNETNFTALPAGYRTWDIGVFCDVGNYGEWWSSTESIYDSSRVYNIEMKGSLNNVHRDNCRKKDGFSIRCVKY